MGWGQGIKGVLWKIYECVSEVLSHLGRMFGVKFRARWAQKVTKKWKPCLTNFSPGVLRCSAGGFKNSSPGSGHLATTCTSLLCHRHNAITSTMIAISFGNYDQHKIVFTHLDSESQSRMYSPPTTGVPPRALLIAVTCRRLDLICSRYWSWVLVLGIGGGYWVLVLGIGYWWWVCVQCTMYMNIARIANAAPCLFEESLWMLRLVRKRWHWNGRKRERGEEEGKETA